MLLYIVRHAYAYEHGDPRWPDDSQRPLEPNGARRFQKVVKRLAERGLAPTLIATSPYVRCRQTAELIAEGISEDAEVVELDALTPGSRLDELIEWSQAQADDSLCWVGHAPDVGSLAAALVGDGEGSIRFAKGAVAAISFDEEIDVGAGELQWLATAKSLGVGKDSRDV